MIRMENKWQIVYSLHVTLNICLCFACARVSLIYCIRSTFIILSKFAVWQTDISTHSKYQVRRETLFLLSNIMYRNNKVASKYDLPNDLKVRNVLVLLNDANENILRKLIMVNEKNMIMLHLMMILKKNSSIFSTTDKLLCSILTKFSVF